MKKKSKKQQDKFSISIIGIIVYSIVLMLVVAGTYLGVKAMFIHHDEQIENENLIRKAQLKELQSIRNDKKEALQTKEAADTTGESSDETEDVKESETVDEVAKKETVQNDHDIDLSLIIDEATGAIDYTKSVFKPGSHHKTLEWQDNVVSRIENPTNPDKAELNSFSYKRIRMKSTEHSDVEINAFTNRDTKQIEKIHAVMNTGKSLEILDMYYDKGNINYASHERVLIDKPEDPTSTNIDGRYYFAEDCLVKYIHTDNGVATGYSLEDISTYKKDVADRYSQIEEEMLNTAYITYNIARKSKETKKICGYVIDEHGTLIPGAGVSLYKGKSDREIASVLANGDGFYQFEAEPDELLDYSVVAKVDGMTEGRAYNINIPRGSGDYYVAPIYLSYKNNQLVYNVQILIRDANDAAKPMANASIRIREGVNSTSGQVIATGCLNEGGGVVLPMTAGCYTAQIDMDGYETSYVPVNIRANHTAILGYCVPKVSDENVKLVCSWETSPLDLDTIAVSSNKKREIKKTVDSIGTMAEVISIDNIGMDDFRVYMYDHGSILSGDAMSYNMSQSNADISVYLPGGYWGTVTVPTSHAGVIWEAIRIRDKKVLPVNSYYYTIEDNSYWTSK